MGYSLVSDEISAGTGIDFGNMMRRLHAHFFSVFLLMLFVHSPVLAGPLGDAAKRGDIAEIERLHSSSADANEMDQIASPLHWAAMKGHADAVDPLAANGASPDAQSDMLGTPFHAASGFGQGPRGRSFPDHEPKKRVSRQNGHSYL